MAVAVKNTTTGAENTTTGVKEQATVQQPGPGPGPQTQGAGQEQPGPTTGTALEVIDFGDDAGKGLEHFGAHEYAIPFVRIIQSNSPQVDDTTPKFIAGAKAGMFLKTSTAEIFDGEKGIGFVPCAKDEQYVEYTPRDAGGGFVGIRKPDDPLVLKLLSKQGRFGRLKTDNNTEMTQTFNLYGLFIVPGDDGAPDYVFRAIIAFASTQIKKYQSFVEIINGIQYPKAGGGFAKPAVYSHRWQLTTQPEQNKKGKFRGIVIKLANGATPRYVKGDPNQPGPRPALVDRTSKLHEEAKRFAIDIEAGKITVDRESDAEAGAGAVVDDDIPF